MDIDNLIQNKQFLYLIDKALFKKSMGILPGPFKVRKYYVCFHYRIDTFICIHRGDSRLSVVYERLNNFLLRYKINTTSAISL